MIKYIDIVKGGYDDFVLNKSGDSRAHPKNDCNWLKDTGDPAIWIA